MTKNMPRHFCLIIPIWLEPLCSAFAGDTLGARVRLGELLAREQSADQFERLVGSGDTALQLRVFDGVHSTSRTSRSHQRVGTVLQWARPFGYARKSGSAKIEGYQAVVLSPLGGPTMLLPDALVAQEFLESLPVHVVIQLLKC